VPDIDPWADQISWVMTFFETFFAGVADSPLGQRKQTLRRAVQDAYEQQGITRDPSTHGNPSPTVQTVISVLEDMLDSPAEFGYATEAEQESVRGDAQSLLKDLRPSFRDGVILPISPSRLSLTLTRTFSISTCTKKRAHRGGLRPAC